jgi:hypothetical protein
MLFEEIAEAHFLKDYISKHLTDANFDPDDGLKVYLAVEQLADKLEKAYRQNAKLKEALTFMTTGIKCALIRAKDTLATIS